MLHELAYFKGNTYRGNSVFFYISLYTATEINPLHVCSVAENTTEINHTGKLIFFIRGGIIVKKDFLTFETDQFLFLAMQDFLILH
jgi:hypothetical protein